jgi:D-arabinose 1-dehydrogenase-like Zn-dependent alcohol dehydrogenase
MQWSVVGNKLLRVIDGSRAELHVEENQMAPTSSAPEAKEERLSTMMAWRVHEFGPLEVMKFELLRPEAEPGGVLVKLSAAGVGPWDGWIRAGKSALPQPLPLTLGSDLSGEVVTVGPGVSELRVGDQVYGLTNPQFIGAYPEYCLASAAMVLRKPRSLTHAEAASLPAIAATAWQALFDHARLKPGQTVVIHGAAGKRRNLRVSVDSSCRCANDRNRVERRSFMGAQPRRKHRY